MNLQPNIPKPSRNEVEKYLLKWRQLEKYYNQERALNKLFFDLCPKNDDIEDILLKCSTLNAFYTTNIFDINAVANHILSLEIDERLEKGDLSLVEDIAKVKVGNPKNITSTLLQRSIAVITSLICIPYTITMWRKF